MKEKLSIVFWLAILIISCEQKRPEKGEESLSLIKEVNSINGPVIYHYSKNQKDVLGVYKRDYVSNDIVYRVSINKDTLYIGDQFVGEITSYDSRKKMLININAPREEYFESVGKRQAVLLNYSPQNSGLYYFRGSIQIDSLIYPFEYKFLVVN